MTAKLFLNLDNEELLDEESEEETDVEGGDAPAALDGDETGSDDEPKEEAAGEEEI
ncbi:MAG: hypothetical protein PHQ47_00140 [Candidatus Portnoybacteria bacterium]|nr:hypothetical protein [Candidatus Portnoybacteria bacterium]